MSSSVYNVSAADALEAGEASKLLPTSFSSSAASNLGLTWAGEPEEPGAPEKTGTILSSAMNLAACALGASMLSLPYAMMIAGPVAAIELLIVFGIMAYFAAQSVVNAGIRCGKSSYADIVTFYFGREQGIFADILLALALAVAAISYIVGLVEMLPKLILITGILSRELRILLVIGLLYPVTLVSNLSDFGPASTFAVAGCYVQAGALLLQLLLTSGNKDAWKVPSASVLTSLHPKGLLLALPMVCFVYAFHYVLTDTLCEVENPTPRRLALVSFSTIGILLGCYVPVAISGYLMLSGQNISPNILSDLPAGSLIVLIAQVSIALLLFATYSLFIIPLRRRIEDIILDAPTTEMTDTKRMAVAGALATAVCVVSVALPDLGLANTLAGGCIAIVMFYFPGALMLRRQLDLPVEERSRTLVLFGALFAGTGALVCFVGLFGGILIKIE